MKKRLKRVKKVDAIKENYEAAISELGKGHNPQALDDAYKYAVILGSLPAKPEKIKVDGDLADLDLCELASAEKYYVMYKENGDMRFLNIAKQKLNHAAALVEVLREQGNGKDAALLDAKRQQLEKVIR